MKKVLFIMAAALLMLSGCNQKIDAPVKAANKTITISLTQTKATISDSGSGAASFKWETGDKIGVEVGEDLVEFELTEFVDETTAKFTTTADISADDLKENAFVAYPYVAEDLNNGTFALSFPSVYEVDKADAFRLRWSGKLTKNGDTFTTSLEHKTAILRVTYASVPEVASAVTMKVDNNDPITVKFTQKKTEHMSFYFPVQQGNYDKIRVALAFDNNGTLTEIDGTAQTLKKKNGQLALEKGKIYRSPEISLNLYELVTGNGQIEDGDYVLAYYDATEEGYKLFSFEKTMANAEEARDAVANIHGVSGLFAQGGQIYSTVIGKNYVPVSGEAGALAINVPADVEPSVVLSVTGNAKYAKTTLATGSYSLRLDKVITSITDNKATLSVQPNAPDALDIMYSLRGGKVTITFNELINFAVEQAQKEGISFTDAQVDRLRTGFEHLCSLAKEMLASHNMGNLMDIDRNTDIFTVIAQYYDNVAAYSLEVSETKKFGWATPVGFHKYDDGFTANVSVPSKGWFDRLQASLQGDKDFCINYWKQFDTQYSIKDIPNFFERLARKAVNTLDDSTYAMLREINFTAIGNVYGRYVERFNDELEPVYLFKKLQ